MAESRLGPYLLAWAFILFLFAALSYYSLGYYDHNDHMYAVAPVIAQHLHAYSDFAFVQTPLSLLIFTQIYQLVGGHDFYLSLRLFSLALQLSTIGLGIALCFRRAERKLFAVLLFASLYVSYRPADIIGAEIGNYTLSLVLTALALVVLDTFRGRNWTPFAVGLFAGLSLSAKLSYIYVVAAFALVYLLWEGAPKSLFLRAAAYGLGVLIGVTPILYYLFSRFDIFLFENVHFHYLSNIYRGLAPFPGLSNLGIFSASSAIVPLAKLFGGCAVAYLLARLAARLWPASRIVAMPLTVFEKEILSIAAATVIGAVTPVIVFAQYLAGPAFAFCLFLALYLDRLLASGRFGIAWRARLAAGIPAVAMALAVSRVYALTIETIHYQRDGEYGITAVAHMRDELSDILRRIDRAHPHCHGDLVTAFGVPAIGTGAQFAPIASTGSFAMRLDDIFVQKAPAYRWMSDPMRYLTSRSLILSGFYIDATVEPKSPFEKVMDDYAATHGFQTMALGSFIYRHIFLYVPAACRI